MFRCIRVFQFVLPEFCLSCKVVFCSFCTILHYLEQSRTVLQSLKLFSVYLALSCTILHYLKLSYTILHCIALSCTILHIRYPCSQQMSGVIALNIIVVTQKVKVLYREPV